MTQRSPAVGLAASPGSTFHSSAFIAMARRKTPRPGSTRPGSKARSANNPESESSPADSQPAVVTETNDAQAISASSMTPSSKTMAVLSALAVLHLVTLAISYLALIEPSSTHARLLSAATPYLRATHFSADGRPFYLAHGTPDEQPHRLQFTRLNDDEAIDANTTWTNVEPAGIAGMAPSDRYHRWMTLVATLSESDRPSLAAALLLPLIESDDAIDAVRIVRLPTELTTVEQDAAPPAYLARVVRNPSGMSLVAVKPKRLTTYARRSDPIRSSETSQ